MENNNTSVNELADFIYDKVDFAPTDLQKQIQFNNKKISTVVDLAGG